MKISRLLRIFSSETRLQIPSVLLNNELCVCQLYVAIGTAKLNISQHLNAVNQLRIVDIRKEGTVVCYSLTKGSLPKYPFLELILQSARKQYFKILEARKEQLFNFVKVTSRVIQISDSMYKTSKQGK